MVNPKNLWAALDWTLDMKADVEALEREIDLKLEQNFKGLAVGITLERPEQCVAAIVRHYDAAGWSVKIDVLPAPKHSVCGERYGLTFAPKIWSE